MPDKNFSTYSDEAEASEDAQDETEVTGETPDDVSIEVTEDTLSIAGTIEKSNEEKDENYYRMERSSGRFSREFVLPSKIDADNVNAEAKNGVITITLDKQPSEQKRKVEIKA